MIAARNIGYAPRAVMIYKDKIIPSDGTDIFGLLMEDVAEGETPVILTSGSFSTDLSNGTYYSGSKGILTKTLSRIKCGVALDSTFYINIHIEKITVSDYPPQNQDHKDIWIKPKVPIGE